MKRILFIAQQAYPVRSSEGICNSKVAYSLAEAGYLVDVFTYKDSSTYPADNKIDTILRQSKNLRIIEIEDRNHKYYLSASRGLKSNLKSLGKLMKMSREIGHFYNGMSNAYDIYSAIKNHVDSLDTFPYDIVMTRAYHSEIAAIYLKEKYGVKWMANWNDPYPTRRFPAPYGKGPNARLNIGYKSVYNKVKAMVDFHTFPCERLKEYMLGSFKNVAPEKTAVIPHMAHSKLLPQIQKNVGCFKIVSCGSVQNPRNPTLFIKALKSIVDELKLTDQDIKCYFVGKYDSFLDSLVKENKLEEIVTLTGPKQYAECLDFIASCDLSLIIEAQCEEGIYLPTKFADAVQCRVPVFCVSPYPGTLNDLVDKYRNGYFSNNKSLESIEKALKQAIYDYRAGSLPIISKDKMGYFYEDEIMKQFSLIIDNL